MSKNRITVNDLKTMLEIKLQCLNPRFDTKYKIKCEIAYVTIFFVSKSVDCIEICEDYLRKITIRSNIFDSSITSDDKTGIYCGRFELRIEAFLNYKPTMVNKMTIEN